MEHCCTEAGTRGARRKSRKNAKTFKAWTKNIWEIFSGQSGNLVVAAIFTFVVVISCLMSTLSSASHKHDKELNCMKTFLQLMEVEVGLAEKSCTTTAKDVRYLQELHQNISAAL